MIKWLRVKNFRQFLDTTLTLSDGITVINGQNGNGKSSIASEATGWILYGKAKKGTKKESIRNRTVNKDATVSGELAMEFGGVDYFVQRHMSAHNGISARVDNLQTLNTDKPLAQGATGTTMFITKLLGVNHQAFVTSFVARQKELDALSDYTDAQRQQFFIRLFGLQAIDKARPNIRKNARVSKETAIALKNQLPDPTDLNTKLRENISTQKENNKKLKEATTKLTKTEKELFLLKEKQAKTIENQLIYSELKTTSQMLNKRELTLESEIINLNKTLEATKEGLTSEDFSRNIDADIKKLEEDRDVFLIWSKHQEAAAEAKINVHALSTDIVDRQESVSRLKAAASNIKLPNVSFSLNELLSKKTALTTEKTILLEQKVTIECLVNDISNGTMVKCPTCYTSLKNGSHALDHIHKELNIINQKIHALIKGTEEVDSEITNSKLITDELEKKTEEHKELLDEIKKIEIIIDTLNESLSREKKRLEQAENSMSMIDISKTKYQDLYTTETELIVLKTQKQQEDIIKEKIATINNINEQIMRNKKELEALSDEQKLIKEQLRSIRFNPDDYLTIQNAVKLAEDAKSTAFINKVSLEKEIALMTSLIDQTKDALEQSLEMQKKVKELKNEFSILSTADTVMGLLREDLARRIGPKIAELTSDLFREVTDGLYQNVFLDDNYNISVMVDNEEWPIEQLSGGEQDAVNLCLRIAISQLILETKGVPCSLLILDEIFGSQDDERRGAIMDIITRLKTIFPQIILITHIDDIKDRADNMIKVSRDESGNSVLIQC